VAEGGGLLNRYTLLKAYRGFESLRLRQPATGSMAADLCVEFCLRQCSIAASIAAAKSHKARRDWHRSEVEFTAMCR
jgi:hypothetical protein